MGPNFGLNLGNINYDGFASANNVMLEDLQKALTAGYGTDSSTMTGGRSLIPESLDKTLVNVLHSQDEAKFFKALKKVPVAATVHEYTKRTEVGNNDGAWVSEGGQSFEKDQTLARRTINMKYLQTFRQVTLQMASVESIEDAEAIEAEAGTLWLVREIEKKLFTGNDQVVAEEPNGLEKAIQAGNILDMRGKAANTSDFENLMVRGPRIIRDSYGRANIMFTSTLVFEDIQALLRDRIRVPAGGGVGSPGAYVFDNYPTIFGNVKLEDDVFIQPGGVPVASTLAGKPAAPVFTVAKANSTSQFTAADAGTYTYILVGVNKYGEGVASASVDMAGVVADDIVTLTIGTPSVNATGYHLYRSTADGGAASAKFVTRVEGINASGVVALPGTIADSNANLPGTSKAYIITLDAAYNAVEWDQFLPMMKFQLYPTNAAVYPFLMLLFGALNVKKEEQCVLIKNIGYSGNA